MKKILYSLFVFLCFTSKAQTQLFTVEDGLSNKDITCVLQARNGYLWVGTANGLNLYDGYTFYEFNRHNGLSNGKIKCLHEDKNGFLWIGTWEGLNILNQETGEIKKLFQKEGAKGSVMNSEITCMEEAPDGSMLVAIGSGVIMKFENSSRFKQVYQLPAPEKLYKYQVFAMKALPDSTLFVLSNYNIVKKLDKNFKEDTTFNQHLELIMDIHVADDKKTLILPHIWGDVLEVSTKTGTILKKTSTKSFVKHDYSAASYLMPGKKLWAGFSGGNVLFTDLVTDLTTDHSQDIKPFLIGLPTCIYPGRNGIVWVGSNYGLTKFCPKKKYFDTYLFQPTADFRKRNSIRGMVEDAKGDIYIGGYSGLFRMDRTGSIKHFKFKSFGDDSVTAFLPYCLLDDSNYIWISSETKGFLRFNKITENLEFPPYLGFFKGFAVLHGGKDSLWVGTHHGLFIYDKVRNTMTKYCNANDLFDISAVEVSELVKDAGGNLWIGSYSSGIFKKEKNGAVVQHFSNADTPYSLNFTTTLFFENDSLLWVGTRGGGLGKINTRTRRISFYTKKDGLADNSVAGIIKDASGILWISTFNGLSRFNAATGAFENYYDKDGLTDNEFNTLAYLKTRAGKIYMGGLNGFNGFYPQHLRRKRKQQPRIFLTRFVKYDGTTNRLTERMLDLGELQDIHFSYRDKFFSFSFALDDYYNPQRNTFYYQLEGYDNAWNNIGTQNTIRFNNLPAGNYRLKIRGVNSEGNVSQNQLEFRISVSRAFYNTWWFYALVFLITVGLVFVITRYRIYQSLKIRQLRTKISSDLHDEVGSLLTRISIQAELIKQGISQDDTVQEVGKIADTSRQATAAMSDVLWSIDARNDKMGNLIDRLREQAGETLFPLEIAVNFDVRNIDPSKEIDTLIRQNLFLIFKEAINNIAKHAHATQVDIVLENKTNQFVMIIKDNGTAHQQPLAPVKQGQGLRNMKMRAELMEGTLEIDQAQGYSIILKLKKFS